MIIFIFKFINILYNSMNNIILGKWFTTQLQINFYKIIKNKITNLINCLFFSVPIIKNFDNLNIFGISIPFFVFLLLIGLGFIIFLLIFYFKPFIKNLWIFNLFEIKLKNLLEKYSVFIFFLVIFSFLFLIIFIIYVCIRLFNFI